MIRNISRKTEGKKRSAAGSAIRLCLFMMVLVMLLLPVTAMAAENTYTVQLIPSSDHVLPGEAFQLYVVVKNDGWPKVKEAEVAALQANLSYDTEKAVFQRMDVNGGTIGQYDPESGLILGFGNKQTSVVGKSLLDGLCRRDVSGLRASCAFEKHDTSTSPGL